MAQVKKEKLNSFRFVSCGVISSAIMAIMLYLHTGKVQDILAKLVEKGKLTNVEWLVKHASYFLPVVAVAIAMTVMYSFFKDESPIVIHNEKTIASIIVLVATYAVMLPIISSKKEPLEDSEKTLMDLCVNWFAFQIVPLLIMTFYHGAKAESEKKLLDRAEELETPHKDGKKTEENKK